MILIDTNVLVYSINSSAPYHHQCKMLAEAVKAKKIPGVIFPQILHEFFSIITNERRVEKPLSSLQALEQVKIIKKIFLIQNPPLDYLNYLENLIKEHNLRGVDIYDASLVAQMLSLKISTICTYNTNDFRRYSEIEVITPEDIFK